MKELKPCPCDECEIRKYYASAMDMHIYKEDCFFACPPHEAWKQQNRRNGE